DRGRGPPAPRAACGGRSGWGPRPKRRRVTRRLEPAPTPALPRERGRECPAPSPACGGRSGWGQGPTRGSVSWRSERTPTPAFPRNRGREQNRGGGEGLAPAVLLAVPGLERARVEAVLAQLAHDGVGVAVGGDHARRAGLAHGAHQVRPVGVVGDDEAAVVVAAAAVAAQAHPAGGESGLGAAEAT